MKTVERAEFKTDPIIGPLYKVILQKYRIATHTKEVLLANSHIKDFCEESRHFAVIDGNPAFYIHFDVSSWLDPRGVLTRVERIAIYDSFQEYQSTRLKALDGRPNS